MADPNQIEQYVPVVPDLPIVTTQKEASKEYKGKLKIFLGYCAGVGKTYRMLQEAITNKKTGTDVVIGLVETHGRKETENLIQELEVIPRKKFDYSGLTVTEMDLDAILARHPQLVLVDELAHTNMPDSRHAKRFQDVEEILKAGIDVFTTVNIQHIQSLVDIVQQITGIKVEEIIPDRMLLIASEIELVDLPIEKLLQRLKEGKVYIPQKAKQAMQKFFKIGNLLALRELSLKYTAKRVDVALLSYREKEDISAVWPVESKLLVCINSDKIAEKLLLIAHRMAEDLKAEWYAVHVESPQQVHLSDRERTQLYKNMHLADELGAKTITLSGNLIADEIIAFAHQKNITLIIAGLSRRSKYEEFFKGSVLNRLVKKSSPINILVVGNEQQTQQPAQPSSQKLQYKYYFASATIIFLFALVCNLFAKWLDPLDILILMLLPTTVMGVLWGSRISVFSSLLSIGLVAFFFVPPRLSFAIHDIKYLASFSIFMLVTSALNLLGRYVRWHAQSARYRERFISALHNFGREIMLAETLDDILKRAVKNIAEVFEANTMILLPDKFGHLELATKSKPDLALSEKEQAVAVWVYKNGQEAGKGATTLSSAKWFYMPLKLNSNVLGVICIIKTDPNASFVAAQKMLLESFANVVALALTKLGHK